MFLSKMYKLIIWDKFVVVVVVVVESMGVWQWYGMS